MWSVSNNISCITSTLNDMCDDLSLINENEKSILQPHLKYTDNNLNIFFTVCKNDITSRKLSGYDESIIHNAYSLNRIISEEKLFDNLSKYCDISGFVK
ncbi:MAG: hypothetical protein SNI70_08260 [Rikenellaceae bacterium]